MPSQWWMRLTRASCPRAVTRHAPGHHLRAQHHRRQAVGRQRTWRAGASQGCVQRGGPFSPGWRFLPASPRLAQQYGESKVVSHTTGYYAVLNFKPYSYFSGAVADVEGKVFNKAGEVQLYIKGNWNVDASIATSPNGPWKARAVPGEPRSIGAPPPAHRRLCAVTLTAAPGACAGHLDARPGAGVVGAAVQHDPVRDDAQRDRARPGQAGLPDRLPLPHRPGRLCASVAADRRQTGAHRDVHRAHMLRSCARSGCSSSAAGTRPRRRRSGWRTSSALLAACARPGMRYGPLGHTAAVWGRAALRTLGRRLLRRGSRPQWHCLPPAVLQAGARPRLQQRGGTRRDPGGCAAAPLPTDGSPCESGAGCHPFQLWTFKYTYWKQREQGAWPDAPDLYGPDSN